MDWPKLFAELALLTTFIFAATAQLKQFGVGGKALTFSAFGIGIVFGGCYWFFVHNPVTPLDWFVLVVFGFMGGFMATGVYKGVESATGKDIVYEVEFDVDDDESELPTEN